MSVETPDPVDLGDLDLTGLDREDIVSALVDAALAGAPEDEDEAHLSDPTDAGFYSADQPRDERGRWAVAASSAVRSYLSATHAPTKRETAALAGHLGKLTVKQLRALGKEHGLKGSWQTRAGLARWLQRALARRREKQTVAQPSGHAPLSVVRDREGAMCDCDDPAAAAFATKKEGSDNLSKSDYAYTPSDQPSDWKLRIDDCQHVAAAAAALGKGFRGQKVDIPSGDRGKVIAKVRAAWKKCWPDKKEDEMPEVLRSKGDAGHSAAFSASVPFDVTGTPELTGAYVFKDAPVVFRAGIYDFPPEKGGPFEMTPEDIRHAVESVPADGVPISNEHNQRCFFQGKLGRFHPKAWADFTGFGGKVQLARPVLDLVGDTPIKLSANFDRLTKTLKDVTLTHTPRITDAALFAAFSQDPEFARSVKVTPHGRNAMQMIHDMSAQHGAVCSAKNASMSQDISEAAFTSKAESAGLQAIHDTTTSLGASCNLYDPEEDSDKTGAMKRFMATYSATPDAPSAREKELERQLKEMQEKSEARFAELEKARHQAERDAALTLHQAEGRAFLDENKRRLYGKRDREAQFSLYLQAARDDLDHQAEVHFTAADGTTQKGSRLAAFKASILARPETNLDVETIPGPLTALFAEGPSPTGGVSAERKKALLAQSQFGQQILREEKRGQTKNGH